MMRPILTLATVAATLAVAAPAQAKQVRFLGPHPIPHKQGGGFCYIEAPHLHGYAPDHAPLYQRVGDQHVFTGDPTPFGYEGERHTFYGHHPIQTEVGPVVCLIDGPHYHAFAPPSSPEFALKGDVAFYVGPPLQVRPQRVKLVNAEVRPFAAARPTVTIEPPPEYHPDVYVEGPEPPQLAIEAEAPAVEVAAPAPPSVHVMAPAPPSVHVIAPAPPSVHVIAPGPPSVGIFAPGPPSVHVVAPGPPSVHVIAPGPPSVGVVVGAPRGGVRVRGGGHHGGHGKHGRW